MSLIERIEAAIKDADRKFDDMDGGSRAVYVQDCLSPSLAEYRFRIVRGPSEFFTLARVPVAVLIIFITIFTGSAALSVGSLPPSAPYPWYAPIAMFGTLAVPAVLGYVIGRLR